jgi:hypothetical protein
LSAIRIGLVEEDSLHQAFKLHDDYVKANRGKSYLWPRSQEYFEKKAQEGHLYGAFEGPLLLAHCYIHFDVEHNVREYGGVQTSRPGGGIAGALSRVAIGANLVEAELKVGEELIAHVHEANTEPLHLLKSLGFRHVGWSFIPEEVAPPDMLRTADPRGGVRGRLYKYDLAKISALGTRLQNLAGFRVSLEYWDADRQASALADISARATALAEPEIEA